MIIWFLPPGETTRRTDVIRRELGKRQVTPKNRVIFAAPRSTAAIKNIWRREEGAKVSKYDKLLEPKLDEMVRKAIGTYKPKLFVVNDQGLLPYFTGETAQALTTHRGFVYSKYGIPVIVIDDVAKTYVEEMSMNCALDEWIFKQDVAKIARHMNGTTRAMPRFHYEVCLTLDDVKAAIQFIKRAIPLVAVDIETSGEYVSSIVLGGCSRITGEYKSYVFPLADDSGCYWKDSVDEYAVWMQIASVLEHEGIRKIYQNGSYDISYHYLYGICVRGGIADTLHMFHAMWAELPKTLAFMASILLDTASFWKDEVKDESDPSVGAYAIPLTRTGMRHYWLYNALDVYMTYMVAFYMSKLLEANQWAVDNYQEEIARQFGPCMYMSLAGMKMDMPERDRLMLKLEEEINEAYQPLLEICGPNYKPKSAPHNVMLFYDLLGDRRPSKRGAPSADVKILERVAEVSPIHAYMLKLLKAYKQPANNLSKYGDPAKVNATERGRAGLKLSSDQRLHYSLAVGATWTGRLGGKSNHLSMGTNPQNVPKKMRTMVVADEGYVLFEADYSQSDLYFVAMRANCLQMLVNLRSGRDVHAIHTEALLGIPYDIVVAGNKADDPFVVHPVTGVRQIIKKVVHGTNYKMGPGTMFANIGRPALVAAALAAGFKSAPAWNNDLLVKFCDKLQGRYFLLYPELQRSLNLEISRCATSGLRVTCHGGRTHQFFNNPQVDHKAKRALASFFGQGGTAMNINQAMNRIFYSSDILDQGARFLLQVHDSLIFAIPLTKLHLTDKIIDNMEVAIPYPSGDIVVPTDSALSFIWGSKKKVPWKRGLDMNELALALEKIRT